MNLQENTLANRIGKSLARTLSRILANSATEGFTRVLEAYLCVLQGKGAGTGWALDAEVHATKSCIHTKYPIIFDVGANVGLWSELAKTLFPGAKLYLFEPQPVCQQRIVERALADATLVPHAVSSTGGRLLRLYTPDETAGNASLHERRDSYFSRQRFSQIEVTTVTIDETIERFGLDRVDFMKIDVEGHELEVLKGAMKSLSASRIRALSFEFGSGNINSRTYFHDFWDLLAPLGYKIFRVLPSSRLMPIPYYYEDCEYFRGVTNYIARREH
jgi:FkbM family methyltransferase